MPITTLYQFSFNSQAFGGAGSPYQIQSVDGLESLPTIRNQDDNRGYNDGMFTGRDFLNARTVSIIFNTFASTSASAQTNYNTIQQALLPQTSGTTPLYFRLSNAAGEQVVNARVRALRTVVDPNYTYGYITSQVDFFCPDPNYYNNLTQTAVMAVLDPVGRTYNRIYNLLYGNSTNSIQTTISNIGWATTYPVISLVGPIIDPILGNVTTNNYLNFTVTLNSAQTLVVDLYNKLVTLNGQPARNLLTSGTWFAAPPGNSIFSLYGTGTAANVTAATVTWNSAYI